MSTAKNKTIRTFNKRSKNYDRTIEGRLAGWSKLLLLEHIVINDNDNILDIGCGTGKLLALLSEKGKANCFGIDITKGMIEAAKKNNPNMTFQISDCVSTPFDSDCFDILTVSMAYHHFTETLRFAQEAKRILKPDGMIYILEMRLPFVLRKFANIIFPILPTGDIKVYTSEEIIKVFSKFDFEIIRSFYRGPIQLLCLKLKIKTNYLTTFH